jgi:hypothetical protein
MWDCCGEASAFLGIDFVLEDRLSFPIAEFILCRVYRRLCVHEIVSMGCERSWGLGDGGA